MRYVGSDKDFLILVCVCVCVCVCLPRHPEPSSAVSRACHHFGHSRERGLKLGAKGLTTYDSLCHSPFTPEYLFPQGSFLPSVYLTQ